jgi:very-short-patch-repair endonuclease
MPRAMDDPAMRRRIRETYQVSMSEIISQYPRYDPYFGFEWSAIFTPIERNVWGDIRDLGLPMYPQFPVGPYFIDFADPVKKLGIEVDSRRYHQDWEQDHTREQALEQQGGRLSALQAETRMRSRTRRTWSAPKQCLSMIPQRTTRVTWSCAPLRPCCALCSATIMWANAPGCRADARPQW